MLTTLLVAFLSAGASAVVTRRMMWTAPQRREVLNLVVTEDLSFEWGQLGVAAMHLKELRHHPRPGVTFEPDNMKEELLHRMEMTAERVDSYDRADANRFRSLFESAVAEGSFRQTCIAYERARRLAKRRLRAPRLSLRNMVESRPDQTITLADPPNNHREAWSLVEERALVVGQLSSSQSAS